MHGTTSVPFDASTFAQLRVSSLFVANVQNAIKPIWLSNVVHYEIERRTSVSLCPCAGQTGSGGASA